jgi:hypothetical protein
MDKRSTLIRSLGFRLEQISAYERYNMPKFTARTEPFTWIELVETGLSSDYCTFYAVDPSTNEPVPIEKIDNLITKETP